MSDLRVLTIAGVPPDPNSGAAGTVFHTNVALRELGHEVDEIWSEDLGPRRIKHGNLHSLLEQPRAYRTAVRRKLRTRDYDVIQMSQPQAYLAARDLKRRGFGGLVINRSHGLELHVNAVVPQWHRRLGIPESRFPRSLLIPLMRKLLERQWPAVVKYSDGIVVPCTMDRDFLVGRIPVPPTRVRTIHHGVPAEFLRVPPIPFTGNRWRRILYVGQFSFIKGPDILLDIANRVLHESQEVSMTWVTSARHHDHIRSRLHPTLVPRVTLVDWSGQRELLEIYDSHGIFVFPSFFEGFGKAPLEAMSRGLCVVATDTGGMRDTIRNGDTGFLCGIGDVRGFVEAVTSLLNDHEKCARVSVAARAAVNRFSWSRCARQMCDFYRDLRKNQCPKTEA